MAKPRIFISSTFYDLRHVRAELERFIREMGYEAVLNERGTIPYGTQEALEQYCYKEIEKVSMVISIIGSRFGSSSKEKEQYSISNRELKAAIEQGKQVYIFVENGVASEYKTYQSNREVDGVKYHHVDNVKIYEFLDEIYSLPFNNQIYQFESVEEIIKYLKEQWAGLFEDYLRSQSHERLNRISDTIQSTAETMKGLVELLRESLNEKDNAIDHVLLTNHPIFNRLANELNVKYRIFFTDLEEMKAWLDARGYRPVEDFLWSDKGFMEFMRIDDSHGYTLSVSTSLFDEYGKLYSVIPGQWTENLIKLRKSRIRREKPPIDDDDEIPF